MSVPLPSPSPLTPASAKPIPSSVSRGPADQSGHQDGSPYRANGDLLSHSPSSPNGSPRSSSYRRHVPNRSLGFTPSGNGSKDGNDENWRERTAGTTPTKSPAVRTVGGFDKAMKSAASPAVTSSPSVAQESADSKTAALSHVPCRFYKAGACTAGANCPFSHEGGAKKEVCQWFLKGNCKFGHKCALAHVRPGEPMSMDRKNKKAQQLETRERDARVNGSGLKSPAKTMAVAGGQHPSENAASPVPIKSALSSAMLSPPVNRLPTTSSPLREPIGPPPPGATSASPGFGRSPVPASAFASSPSRPSPLSGSFSARPAIPGSLSMKSNLHSPLRPPTTAFSSSFSASSLKDRRRGTSPVPPLSASFADGARKNIWARSESRPEVLSPRREAAMHRADRVSEDVFIDTDGDDDEGDDLAFAVPDTLAELLTPRERARRMSRRDSQDSFSASPSRGAFAPQTLWSGGGAERLAQSAGPTMGPGYLQGLWSAEGGDARKIQSPQRGGDPFTFGPDTAQIKPRQSLLTQQISPTLPQDGFAPASVGRAGHMDHSPSPFLVRAGDPSSPSARALQEHAPGQSVPGGVATALSRLHLHGNRPGSGLAYNHVESQPVGSDGDKASENGSLPRGTPGTGAAHRKDDLGEEGMFELEG